MQRGNVLLLSRLNILQGGKNRIRHWIGSFQVRKQFGQIADIRQGKIGRRQCVDGRTGVQAKREHRQRQDRFPAGFARGRGFGLFGLVLRFRCRGHVCRPQMSEQKTEPSLDRPRDGSSTRHPFNWSGLWADEINSTLSPQFQPGDMGTVVAGTWVTGSCRTGCRRGLQGFLLPVDHCSANRYFAVIASVPGGASAGGGLHRPRQSAEDSSGRKPESEEPDALSHRRSRRGTLSIPSRLALGL